MILNSFMPALGFALLLTLQNAPAAEVVVEAPQAESGVKLFDFPGGTPKQYVEQLKTTFGTLGLPVIMEDKTQNQSLPPMKEFGCSAIEIIQRSVGSRIQFSGDTTRGIKITFVPEPPSDPFAADRGPTSPKDPFAADNSQAGGRETPEGVLFQFSGGTAAELVAALDSAFKTRLADVATIAPEFSAVRLPALKMKAADPLKVIELLNRFSMNTAGTCGYWSVTDLAGDTPSKADRTAALMISPRYDERNPPPAIAARDAAESPERRAIRKLEAQAEAMQNAVDSANHQVQELQERVKALQPKAP